MRHKVFWLVVFAVAMGYLEAAVVVYLRQIFYPEGFAFPIKRIALDLGLIELGREAATILMLLGVAFVLEETRRGRLACFMLLFGIWDITYYVWLWVTVAWPASLLTWDLLFLLPVIWTGPVIAPVLVALLLTFTGLVYYLRRSQTEAIAISGIEWAVAIAGAVVIFIAFAYNHGVVFRGGIPTRFPWLLFAAGVAMGGTVLVRVIGKITCRALTSRA